MAMPIGSMIAKFRGEFEAYIEEARARNDALTTEEAPPEALIQGAVA
jgi:NADH-quinone oxidoreductase subunit F